MTSLHLGLDLGGTNIKVAVLARNEGNFELVATDSVATRAEQGPESVTATLVEAGRDALERYASVTLGIGVPGSFTADTGQILLFPNLPGAWHGFPLQGRLEEALGLPTAMINDARAFTLAESLLGAGRYHRVVACITLGTGVGGGIAMDGRLYEGAFGVAGEIGHQTLDPDGPPCGCGNRGCLEALIRSDVFASNAGRATPREVFEGARDNDPQCLAAITQMADYLGVALANVVAILGPDCIVVGGGIAEAGDLVIRPIEEALRRRVTLVPTSEITVSQTALGHNAGAIGAALAGALAG